MNEFEDFRTTGSFKIGVGHPKDLDIDTTSLQEIIPQVRFNNFCTHFRVLKNAASPIFILLTHGTFTKRTTFQQKQTNVCSPIFRALFRRGRSHQLEPSIIAAILAVSTRPTEIRLSRCTVRNSRSPIAMIRGGLQTLPLQRIPFLYQWSTVAVVRMSKIYHDASRTFYVRKAVDSWSYQSEHDGTKVRVLRGVQFPLMDEVWT